MLKSQLNQMMYLNRRSEKPILTQAELISKIDKETYQRTIVSLLNVHFFLANTLSSFQYCRDLEISQSTAFLAKAYLDIIIKKLREVNFSELSLLCICCVWVAIKFNQSLETSSNFNLQIMHQHGNGSFSTDELKRAEIMVCSLLTYKLAYTTPYHYIDPFFQSFPWFTSIKKVMFDMIDFTITIPELSCESAENLFFGIFTSCLKIKKYALTPLQQSVLNAQIVNPQAVSNITRIIVKYYNIAINGDDAMDEETQEQEKRSNSK